MARGAPKEEENWGCQRPLYRRDDGRAESLWRGPRTGALESIVYVVRRVPDCALAGCVWCAWEWGCIGITEFVRVGARDPFNFSAARRSVRVSMSA